MDLEADRVGILEGQDATVRIETHVALRRRAVSRAPRMYKHVANDEILDFDVLRIDCTDSASRYLNVDSLQGNWIK